MDSDRFDHFARALATAASRRRLLRLFGGGALATLAGARAAGSAIAIPRQEDCRAFCNAADLTGAVKGAATTIAPKERRAGSVRTVMET